MQLRTAALCRRQKEAPHRRAQFLVIYISMNGVSSFQESTQDVFGDITLTFTALAVKGRRIVWALHLVTKPLIWSFLEKASGIVIMADALQFK